MGNATSNNQIEAAMTAHSSNIAAMLEEANLSLMRGLEDIIKQDNDRVITEIRAMHHDLLIKTMDNNNELAENFTDTVKNHVNKKMIKGREETKALIMAHVQQLG